MTTTTSYEERLGVPLRWWALATMFLASVLLAFLVAVPTSVAFGAAGLLVAAMAALFVGYGSARIAVRDGELVAGQARIPVRFLADPTPLDREQARRVLGVEADARAYLLVRPYLKRAVKVSIVDPDDPTPYWVMCTRHPGRLTAAIAEAIAAAR